MTDATPLSTAAQAVLDAAAEAMECPDGFLPYERELMAAALRAAADQVVPEAANAVGEQHDEARRDQWLRIRWKLLAIAAELEGGPGSSSLTNPMEQANTKTPARPMTTDLRALCARMAAELDHYRQLLSDDRRELHPLAVEARAALAADGPAVPEDREPASVADKTTERVNRDEAVAVYSEVMAAHECQTLGDMAEHFARAVLARWGRPAPATAGERQAAQEPLPTPEPQP